MFFSLPDCKAVRLFGKDFSKAFDSAKHELLAKTLKSSLWIHINYRLVLELFKGWKSKGICCNNFECDWKPVNKGTTQGSVSGPYLFNIFLNDLNITLGNHDALFKYADDSTIIAPVWKEVDCSDQLLSRLDEYTNWMSCNPSKCKGLTIKKRGNRDLCSPIGMIPSCKEVRDFGRHLPMWQQISFSAREEQTY